MDQVAADESGAARYESTHVNNSFARYSKNQKKGGTLYLPEPATTTQAVRHKILRSKASDQRRIYSRSSATHWSKSDTWLRPLTCQRQGIPGVTAIFCRWYGEKRTYSVINGGRGPTKLMSPLSTL